MELPTSEGDKLHEKNFVFVVILTFISSKEVMANSDITVTDSMVKGLQEIGIHIHDNSKVDISTATLTANEQYSNFSLLSKVPQTSEGSVIRIVTELGGNLVKEDLVCLYEENENGDFSLARIDGEYIMSQMGWSSDFDIVAYGAIYYYRYLHNLVPYYKSDGCSIGVSKVKKGYCEYIAGQYIMSGVKHTFPDFVQVGSGQERFTKAVTNPVTGELYYRASASQYAFTFAGGPYPGAGNYYEITFRMRGGSNQYYTAIHGG